MSEDMQIGFVMGMSFAIVLTSILETVLRRPIFWLLDKLESKKGPRP